MPLAESWPDFGGTGARSQIVQSMSFDTLAPHYRWMELLLAGNLLQQCRTCLLPQVSEARHILILGEGNGRFLAACSRQLPSSTITCVDASARMLALARDRLDRSGLNTHRIEFVHADILEWTPPPDTFDLVVTHFFLDCFRPDQVNRIIARLANAALPRASWLLAEFQIPPAGPARHRARLIHWLLYKFFRAFTRIPACSLTPPDQFLGIHRFRLAERKVIDWGLLRSDRWTRE